MKVQNENYKDKPTGRIVNHPLSRLPFILATLSLIAIATGACAPQFHTHNSRDNGATSFADSTNTPKKASAASPSDNLTDEGESLIENVKFNEAYGKFNEALQKNPEDRRAAFWSAVLKPFLELKGIKRRVAPLYQQVEHGPERYRQMIAESAANPSQTQFHQFLFDGPEDIRSSAELQDWMDRYRHSLATMREKLRAIRDSEITISVPASFQFSSGDSNDDCRPIQFGPIKFDNGLSCGKTGARLVGLNRGDFEALLWGAGIMQFYLEMWTAYTIDPVALSKIQLRGVNKQEDLEYNLNQLWSIESFGKIRDGSKPFIGVRSSATDMAAALKYAIERQRELCPFGTSSPESRKGYLVSNGFCVEVGTEGSDTLRLMQSFEAFLGGQPVDIGPGSGPQMLFLPSRFIERPPQDLRALSPLRFDQCANLVAINKNVASEYFVGDVNEYLEKMAARARENCPIRGEK